MRGLRMDDPRQQTRAWLRDVVVKLSLCPYAAEPLQRGRVRFAESTATQADEAWRDLMLEAERLATAEPSTLQTTLLILPEWHTDFVDFWEATQDAEELLLDTHLPVALQVVAFHPEFRFGDAEPDDPANGVNRSPHPMWHLLRADDVAEVVRNDPSVHDLPDRNRALLRALAGG